MSEIIAKLSSGQIVFLLILAMACVTFIAWMVLQVIENELERHHGPKRRVRKPAVKTGTETTVTDLPAVRT